MGQAGEGGVGQGPGPRDQKWTTPTALRTSAMLPATPLHADAKGPCRASSVFSCGDPLTGRASRPPSTLQQRQLLKDTFSHIVPWPHTPSPLQMLQALRFVHV